MLSCGEKWMLVGKYIGYSSIFPYQWLSSLFSGSPPVQQGIDWGWQWNWWDKNELARHHRNTSLNQCPLCLASKSSNLQYMNFNTSTLIDFFLKWAFHFYRADSVVYSRLCVLRTFFGWKGSTGLDFRLRELAYHRDCLGLLPNWIT